MIVTAAATMAVALAASCRAEGLDDALLEKGRAAFDSCRSCHALEPAATGFAGPNLVGLIGRRVGGSPDYDYSPVLRDAGDQGIVWDTTRLDRFLADPEGMFPGMWMSYPGIADEAERRALVAFIVQHQ